LKELEDAKFLEVKQRGLGKTNLYRLFLTVKKHGATQDCRAWPAKFAGPERQRFPPPSGRICRSLNRRIGI
jgi:hypothetical protein